MKKVHPSKVDTWLALLLVCAMTPCLIVFVLAVYAGNSSDIAIASLAVVLGFGFPAWVMFATHYTLTDSTLLVRCGPFRWQVPVAQIVSVTPTRNPLSSPALSLDRLRIDYGRGKSIMISPKDKASFMQDLQQCGVEIEN